MRNNVFSALVFFFILGFVLYYSSRNHPFERLKSDFSKIFGLSSSKKPIDNEASDDDPARKKYPDDIAIDTQKEENKKETKEDKVFDFDIFKEKKSEDSKNESIENDLSQFLPSYKSGEIVKHQAIVLNYLEEYEQANWVIHRLSPKAQFGNSKRNDNFRPDPEVSTSSANPHDFARSGYDRGHLCPAGDFKYDPVLQDETFFMSNMSPQVPDLNRNIWNDLEGLARRWAVKHRGLIVVTGPVLEKGLETIGLQNQIAVPKKFYKILYDEKTQKAIGFVLENKGSFELLRNFAVSINEIEKMTGIDFFAKLSDAIQKDIEAQNDFDDWN